MNSKDRGAIDDDVGFPEDVLASLEEGDPGVLADFYFAELDLDPEAEFRRPQQLQEIVDRRGLTIEKLGRALEVLREKNCDEPD